MVNRFFKKVVKFCKEEYKFLIVLFLILFLGLYRLPYNLYVGGGIISLEKRLEVENSYPTSGSFNLCYVKSIRSTIPTYLLSYVFNWQRESINDLKIDENDNTDNMWEREKLYLKEANDNAVISAFKEAGEDITINKEILKILYVDIDSDTDLKVGDTIISINNIEIKEYDEIKDIVKDFNVGDKVSVRYLREDKEASGYFKVREINGEKKAGLYLVKLYDYKINREINLDFANSEGGPSGGMMVSLAIYNKITQKDILKGRIIAGTGTVDSNGNVGEIGGVKYKLRGAVNGNAEIFLVGEANYEEALHEKIENNYDIIIFKVKNISDAIKFLGG